MLLEMVCLELFRRGIVSGAGASAQSIWPDSRAAARVLASGMQWSTSFSTLGTLFESQYWSLRRISTRARGVSEVRMKGPVPDGLLANLPQSPPSSFQRAG